MSVQVPTWGFARLSSRESLLKDFFSTIAAPPKQVPSKRDTLRLAIPSKGRMAEDTQQLLKVLAAHLLLQVAAASESKEFLAL